MFTTSQRFEILMVRRAAAPRVSNHLAKGCGSCSTQPKCAYGWREAVITIRIRSAALRAPSFFMMLAR